MSDFKNGNRNKRRWGALHTSKLSLKIMYIGQVQYSWSFGCLISKMEIATKNDGVQWRNEKRSSMAVFNKLGELTKHIQQIHPIPF